MLVFLVGLLLGVLLGGTLCVRFLRHEISANVGPRLRQLTLKVETLESVLNLALATGHTEPTPVATPAARRHRN